MSTFDLSMAITNKPVSDVQASTEHEKKYDEKQGVPIKQTITDSGITIDKSKSPALKLDGPLGHNYTQLLNEQLSLESMGAIAAAMDAVSDEENKVESTGKVAVTSQGASVESPSDIGYIYITNADTLESKALAEVSSKLINHRLKNPEGKMGLAMLTGGKATPVVESIANTMEALDVEVVYSEAGLKSMARRMVKG